MPCLVCTKAKRTLKAVFAIAIRVARLLQSVWDRRKEILLKDGSLKEGNQTNATRTARSMAPSAMAVESK